MTTVIDPVKLSGLKQAAYVMDCLVNHIDSNEIIRRLDGDEQLYQMWKLFLVHNNWITEIMEGWSMTAKGARWSDKVGSVLPA